MSTFEDREKSYEKEFVHTQEKDFKIRARRNKLLGRWAVEMMQLEDQEAERYIANLVSSAVDGVANQTVKEIIMKDFKEKGLEISEKEIVSEMERLLQIARDELHNQA